MRALDRAWHQLDSHLDETFANTPRGQLTSVVAWGSDARTNGRGAGCALGGRTEAQGQGGGALLIESTYV